MINGVVLAIFDGLGIALPGPGNAFFTANPPTFNSLNKLYPHTQLKASGEAVGMPANEVGNTEVGHVNISAGRVIFQSLPRIDLSIADGSFFDNKILNDAVFHAMNNHSNLHIIGLLGAGTVHASTAHLNALLYLCREKNFNNVFIHIISDGRDSPPKGIMNYLGELEYKMSEIQVGKIASIMGRYYAMDRDHRWERIERAYKALTEGIGEKAGSFRDAINNAYSKNLTDEFIEPTLITEGDNKPVSTITNNDSVIFYNYRIDRPRELTKAFVLDNFEKDANNQEYPSRHIHDSDSSEHDEGTALRIPFQRGQKLHNLYFATMTEYEAGLPVHVAFPPHRISDNLGEILSKNDKKQLRIAESEKERFVTKYFNGLQSEAYPNEDRIIVSSPNVPTYDQKPEMSAYEITDKLIENIPSKKYSFILINYANADMVGHTGNFQAAERAVTVLDECLAKLMNVCLENQYLLLVTADHGNIEEMLNPKTGAVSTEHSANPVPFVAIDSRVQNTPTEVKPGILADIAPTVLAALGIPKPINMTGRNLLEGINELQSS